MPATYIIVDGEKILQLEDGSRVPVTAPLSLDQGSKVALIATQLDVLELIGSRLETLLGAQASNWAKLQAAPDLAQAIAYLDSGTADQRIATITYASAALQLSMTETFTYAGSSGNYRLTGVARS